MYFSDFDNLCALESWALWIATDVELFIYFFFCSQPGKFNFLRIMISFVLGEIFWNVLSLTYISK